MKKGFIFNPDLCVGCGACRAACSLYNKWDFMPRTIFTYSDETAGACDLINLSLACNHCETAVCLEGCPAACFSRDEKTDSVLTNSDKCIGCRYCTWNCPYDAPKYHDKKKVIEKCNNCYILSGKGMNPACADGCPTGALSFGNTNDSGSNKYLPWFPDKDLGPSISFSGKRHANILRLIPPANNSMPEPKPDNYYRNSFTEWSLLIFSFLSTMAVALVFTSLIDGVCPEKTVLTPLLFFAAISSLFHLGHWERAWRALTNIKRSPLSREIAGFVLFSVFSIVASISRNPAFITAAALSGVTLLGLIDAVYLFSDARRRMILSSGQTLLSAFLIIAFFSGNTLPLFILAFLKTAMSVYHLYVDKTYPLLRIFRLFLLFAAIVQYIFAGNESSLQGALVLVSGEFIDRLLFYLDFKPLNIKHLLIINKNKQQNEN